MASMQTITCKCGCGQTKEVRTADVKRGWGKYIDKSHKARHQTRMTGKGKPIPYEQGEKHNDPDYHPLSDDNFSIGM